MNSGQNIIIKTENNSINIPQYATIGSAGFDIRAYCEESIIIKPNETKLIPTGLFMEIPQGYEGQIRSRSGLALNNKIVVLNSPGTIDSDYRGEIKVILHNFGKNNFVIENNMRVAQMIIVKYEKVNFIKQNELNKTNRDNGGFGSTGVK